ncbi:Sphingosine-1-phosphate lyase [Diplonema papillatum]|nr:Sphingosine-1-phosphate lyase [Diplonema papillatum]
MEAAKAISERADQLVQSTDAMLDGSRPTKLVVQTAFVVLVGMRMLAVLRLGPSECIRRAKACFFYYARKYFGHMLGYDKAIADARVGFLKDFVQRQSTMQVGYSELPLEGLQRDAVLQLCREHADLNSDFTKGQYSGSVYHGGMGGYTEFINEAMDMHQWTNPLHGGQFAGVRKMEAETIAMCVKMFNGDENACGAMTSGGTESIVCAIRAYKEYAKMHKGITEPELVVPVTAHAAFDKGCEYFGIKLRHVRIDSKTCKVDMKHMKSLITSNTIALAGSAPQFPHGIIDPISEIAALGLKYDIPVHVDACLGGFVIAFMEKAGIAIDEKNWDFRNAGVTSISCDNHKYGFAPKGSSVILYQGAHYREHQMFTQPDWPGGIYASPTLAGSRPGNVVAGTWAAMVSFGENGYVESAARLVKTAKFICDELRKIEGVIVMGAPCLTVVAAQSQMFDIFLLGQMLGSRHWEMNMLQFPSALHIAVTNLHALNDMEHARRFVADVRECAAELVAKGCKGTSVATLYGTSQQIPDRQIVGDVARMYFDAYYDSRAQERLAKLEKAQ